MPRVYPSLEERFWAKVNKNGPVPPHMPHLGPCWVWTAAVDDWGYGTIEIRHFGKKAHRVSFFLICHRWPKEKLLHRCDNPPCVRPSHLFEGSDQDNMDDMIEKGRKVVVRGDRHFLRRFPHKAMRGEMQTQAKLTSSDVTEIRRRRSSGESLRLLADEFGISEARVSQIALRHAWKHLK